MIGTLFKGALGNNMFQYAYIRSAAERIGVDFSITHEPSDNPNNLGPIHNRYGQFDSIFPHLKFNKVDIRYHFKYRLREETYFFREDFFNIKDDTYVYGFFQNYLYFNREDAKSWFKIYLDDNDEIEYNNYITKYSPDKYCYVNFRGREFMGYKIYTDKNFYNIAQSKIGKSNFLVITDDIENSKLNILGAEDYICPNFRVALKLLNSSKSLIIPKISTFSWWGAYLSDADVIIAPENGEHLKTDVFNYL